MIDVDRPGTFSTDALEKHIEAMLAECGPPEKANVSFGVNTERWRLLEAAVREYLRIVRNGRGARAASEACN
jgi:hypothetical protein